MKLFGLISLCIFVAHCFASHGFGHGGYGYNGHSLAVDHGGHGHGGLDPSEAINIKGNFSRGEKSASIPCSISAENFHGKFLRRVPMHSDAVGQISEKKYLKGYSYSCIVVRIQKA